MTILTTDKKVYDFIEYAKKAHEAINQEYGDGKPYGYHLQQVANRVQTYAHCVTHYELEVAMQAAWGHDLIEDANLTYNDVKAMGGEDVAEAIYACTEEKGRNRAERHNDRFYMCLTANKIGLMVKLADLQANISESISTGHRMERMYRKEWPIFKDKIKDYAIEYGLKDMVDDIDKMLAQL